MKCHKCGERLFDGDTKCRDCGYEKTYKLGTVLQFAEEFMGIDITDADHINAKDTEILLDEIEERK